MSISIIKKRDVIKAIPKRWRKHYPDNFYGNDKLEIWQKLALLNTETCDPSVIDDIIGNESWTSLKCDECDREQDILVRIGEEPDYEARWQDLCADCLRAALRFFTL